MTLFGIKANGLGIAVLDDFQEFKIKISKQDVVDIWIFFCWSMRVQVGKLLLRLRADQVPGVLYK